MSLGKGGCEGGEEAEGDISGLHLGGVKSCCVVKCWRLVLYVNVRQAKRVCVNSARVNSAGKQADTVARGEENADGLEKVK